MKITLLTTLLTFIGLTPEVNFDICGIRLRSVVISNIPTANFWPRPNLVEIYQLMSLAGRVIFIQYLYKTCEISAISFTAGQICLIRGSLVQLLKNPAFISLVGSIFSYYCLLHIIVGLGLDICQE